MIENIKIGISVGDLNGIGLETIVKAFEKSSGRDVPYQIVDRRPGDIATCYADPTYAEKRLGWKVECELDEMCEDTWRWQSINPDGYSR